MNFKATACLLSVMGKFIHAEHYRIQTEGHKNYLGAAYTADYVEIIDDPQNSVSFEVTEDEIIVFFFTDHVHFNDYGIDLEDNEPDYVARAAEFLEKLFTLPIERRYTLKGNRVIRDESLFRPSETEKESCAGVIFYFAGIQNIFQKKRQVVEIKRFDQTTGTFLTDSE